MSRTIWCFSCESMATPQGYKQMARFIIDCKSGIRMEKCAACEKDVPQTSVRYLIDCGHIVCLNCLYTEITSTIPKVADWLKLKCPARGCASTIHHNDVKDTIEKEKYEAFNSKVDRSLPP